MRARELPSQDVFTEYIVYSHYERKNLMDDIVSDHTTPTPPQYNNRIYIIRTLLPEDPKKMHITPHDNPITLFPSTSISSAATVDFICDRVSG